MGCSSSVGLVPSEAQIKKPNALMDWIDSAQNANSSLNEDQRIVKAVIGDKVGGEYSNLANVCTLTRKDGSETLAFFKMSKDGGFEAENNIKLARHREAEFFNMLKENTENFEHCVFPEVYLATGDPATGRCIILMENVEGAQNLMQVFGDWKFKMRPDLERPITISGDKVTAIELTRHVARSLAEMHAKFWMNKEFLEANKSWILRADWFAGENLDFLKGLADQMQQIWAFPKKRIISATVMHELDPQVLEIISACYAKTTPDGFKKYYADRPNYQWTMVHGDMHPGNFVYDPKKKLPVMIDMELFGQGCGPQDLASFMFFRTSPEWRQKHEKEIVELYYSTLIECSTKFGTNVTNESYPIEQCWKDYAHFGAMRMVFYFSVVSCLVKGHVVIDLEKSIKSFITDHNVTPEDVPPYSP